jgi:hypothetical protein
VSTSAGSTKKSKKRSRVASPIRCAAKTNSPSGHKLKPPFVDPPTAIRRYFGLALFVAKTPVRRICFATNPANGRTSLVTLAVSSAAEYSSRPSTWMIGHG